jgi:GT2 family glycosyltransferase
MTHPTPRTKPPTRDAAAARASVILVNYNGREHLGGCLEALLGEDHDDVDVLVVDNASTDGSADYIHAHFPPVRVVRSATNLGYAAGNNLGVRESAGRILVFLNPDTVVEPGWLDPLIRPLETDPGIGMTTARIVLLGQPQSLNTGGNDVHVSGLTLCRGMGQPRGTLTNPVEVGAVSGAAFAMRRDLFEALGGFDEDYFTYMEDTDLSLRARLAGYRVWYTPESVVRHDYTLRFGPHKTFFQERNRYQTLLKTLRWRTLMALAPALVLAEVVTWGFVLTRERRHLMNKPRAFLWILANWGRIMAKRRRVQAGRKVSDRALLAAFTHRLGYEQTGEGPAARLAQAVFDPLFWIARTFARALVLW